MCTFNKTGTCNESEVDGKFEVVLPIWFATDSLENFAYMIDSVEIDLSDLESQVNIERVNILLEASNGLPVDIDLQVFFYDENYNPVDTLFNANATPIIRAGVINDEYRVTSSTSKNSIIEKLHKNKSESIAVNTLFSS